MNEGSTKGIEFTNGDASGLVDYQKGSIISREILKKETGTVTVFAFDIDQGLSEHTAPFDALVHVLDGVVDISIDGKSKNYSKGELVLMPANIPHALKAVEQFKMMLIMIKSTYIKLV